MLRVDARSAHGQVYGAAELKDLVAQVLEAEVVLVILDLLVDPGVDAVQLVQALRAGHVWRDDARACLLQG